MKLRQGRRVGRTLYHQQGPEPTKDDPIIGLVDDPELAATIVQAINEREGLLADLDHAERDNRRLTAELDRLKR